jgi:photosystem II stability/assembly factor-like uncharacterized protein
MRKILLLLFFTTSYWQVQAQLKITTTATKLCEGTSIPLQVTGIPANSNLQWQKDGNDITNANTANYSSSTAGSYVAKALGKNVQWNRKSPDVDYGYLRDATFLNAKIGYAIGQSGIIKTIDGGNSWNELNINTNSYTRLNALHFMNEQTGWAVGEYNRIITTSDGGNTWKDITRNDYWGGRFDNTFYNVFFIDSKIGWITEIGGLTLKTVNGGTTWTPQVNYDYNDYVYLYGTAFSDANTIWSTDFFGKIRKSVNDGKTWTVTYNLDVDDPSNKNLSRLFSSIYFVDAKNGWAVGDKGLMVNTVDGGKTWTLRKDIIFSETLADIFFVNAKIGYATSYGREYFQTIDGGVKWTKKDIGINLDLSRFTFVDENNGFGVGAEGLILKTINGGVKWDKLRGNTDQYLSVHFINANIGFRAGTKGLIEKTIDGGKTWKLQNSNTTNNLNSIQFTDENTGFIMNGTPYVGVSSSVLKTTDGGSTWKNQATAIPRYINDSHFFDANIGIIVADGSIIAKTTNGGTTWVRAKALPDTNLRITSVSFINSKTGWAVGDRGIILKTIDGGDSWQILKQDPKYVDDSFSSVFFIDTKIGWLLHRSYRSFDEVLKTTDGGSTWTVQGLEGQGFKKIFFADSKNGWVVGDFQRMVTTTNGGDTWTPQELGTYSIINDLQFLNAQTGWAVGNGNTFIKYEAPTLSTSNTITINPKPAVPTLAWSNSDGKLTATTTTTSPQLTWLKGVDELKNVTATTYQPTSSGSYSVRVTDGNGCSEISKAVEITILASENPLNDLGVNVYPNPSSSGIFKVAYTRFSNEMEATMQVIGLDGLPLNSQKMVRQNNTFEGEINASNLATGIYLLQIVSGEQKAVVKISIAK